MGTVPPDLYLYFGLGFSLPILMFAWGFGIGKIFGLMSVKGES